MSLIIRTKASKMELKEIAEHFDGYIKVVVDVDREILAGGGGSRQKDLWGGGLDIETGEIDYNSIINLRPKQDNPSRDILSKEIREKFDKIVKKLLL